MAATALWATSRCSFIRTCAFRPKSMLQAPRERHLHVQPALSIIWRVRRSPCRVVSQHRHESSKATAAPLTERSETSTGSEQDVAAQIAARKAQNPAYQMTFTCRKCDHRSTHIVSKQSYHHGTTLIACPGCKVRHLISDHLRIFSDENVTVEDILKEKGEFLRKGRLGEDGDIEFYDEKAEPSEGNVQLPKG